MFALDPAQDISQYAHKSWKVRDGFPEGVVESIAQTTDGYLWLGTTSGLFRFDGVRHWRWDAAGNDRAPNGAIRSLLAADDGSLWIGMPNGLAHWAAGKITDYRELAGFNVFSLVQDHQGTIWTSGFAIPRAKICAIRSVTVQCDSVSAGVTSLYEDSHHNLWAGTATGLWRWKPEPSKFYPMSGADPLVTAVIEAKPGEMIVGTVHGVHQLANSGIDPQPLAGSDSGDTVRRLMRDRDGGMWIGTNHGLLHFHQGRADSYTRSDGLTGDVVTSLYEDREGDVWVGTQDGLDQFRGYPVSTISSIQGLRGTALATLAASDGSIWFGAGEEGLDRWKDGEVSNYRMRPARPSGMQDEHGRLGRRAREIIDAGLGDDAIGSLAKDSQGHIWAAGIRGGLSVLLGERFSRRLDLGEGYISAMVSDRAESLWISHYTQGLIHLVGQRIAERIAWDRFGSRGYAVSLQSDSQRGGIWLGFFRGGITYFADGQQHSYDRQDGLGPGEVKSLYLDQEGTLWAATQGGLSRLKNGRVQTLTTNNGLPCPFIHWVIQDDLRFFWLGTSCGVVRLDERELDEWASGSVHNVHPSVFASTDGVRSEGAVSDCSPLVTKAPDGRLWFQVTDGISVIDPRHLHVNKLPPPVHIEQITADRKTYDAPSNVNEHFRLPPLIRDLEIDYSALSLVAPEKNQFRYKLEGHDPDWQDVGNRRQAFYNELPPGNYRFRVVASNNSGVWNEQGAALNFSIAPAYWQTNWFRAACVATFLLVLWALYQLRLRQIRQAFNARLEERVGERTRIARDLHDTLLQSFQGLLLRFQTARELLRTRPAEGEKTLESAIDQTAHAITEGRMAVQGLRASTVERNDLAKAITTQGEELAATTGPRQTVGLQVDVEGTPRTLHPIVRDEIYRIAGEALRNAFQHAEAKQIEVELHYGERQFRLRIRDDGKGIDAHFLTAEGRAGHFGLQGMRERAKLIGGELTVWTAPDSGTEIDLNIPATHAYLASSAAWRSWLNEKLLGGARRSGHDKSSQSDPDRRN